MVVVLAIFLGSCSQAEKEEIQEIHFGPGPGGEWDESIPE